MVAFHYDPLPLHHTYTEYIHEIGSRAHAKLQWHEVVMIAFCLHHSCMKMLCYVWKAPSKHWTGMAWMEYQIRKLPYGVHRQLARILDAPGNSDWRAVIAVIPGDHYGPYEVGHRERGEWGGRMGKGGGGGGGGGGVGEGDRSGKGIISTKKRERIGICRIMCTLAPWNHCRFQGAEVHMSQEMQLPYNWLQFRRVLYVLIHVCVQKPGGFCQ